jgi:hypothetical protein
VTAELVEWLVGLRCIRNYEVAVMRRENSPQRVRPYWWRRETHVRQASAPLSVPLHRSERALYERNQSLALQNRGPGLR